jgi:hypothetical protein
MVEDSIFPPLAGEDPTVKTLHWYAKGIGVVTRAHIEQHPKWWHLGLEVESDGLVTRAIPMPNGDGSLSIKLDLIQHNVLLAPSDGDAQSFSLREGLTSTAFGDQLLAAVTELGFTGEYAREKFENVDAREYDPETASRYLDVWKHVDRIFKKHQATLKGETGPVQLWPHGFDIALEWFGTRKVENEKDGEVTSYPSQLNLGFSPGDESHPEPYFFSNPWPFEEEKLVDKTLPKGARWFTASWKGSIFPYAELVGNNDAEERLLAYAKAVYEICAPNLTE